MTLTIFSYNIHSGKNLFYQRTFSRMVDYFRRQTADIIALQEVQNNSKQGWQFEHLRQAVHRYAVFGPNIRLSDGYYGNAILSRFPVLEYKNYPLQSEREQRGLLHAVLEVNGRAVHVFNTHLGLGRKERAQQMAYINERLLTCHEPCILMGDFNTVRPIDFLRMSDTGKKAGKAAIPTIFPLKKRIDYVFCSSSFELVEYEVPSITYSDHYPVKVTIDLLKKL